MKTEKEISTKNLESIYNTIFYSQNRSAGNLGDTRNLAGGPFALRATTITFENCTANDYSTTFGLEPSAVAT